MRLSGKELCYAEENKLERTTGRYINKKCIKMYFRTFAKLDI